MAKAVRLGDEEYEDAQVQEQRKATKTEQVLQASHADISTGACSCILVTSRRVS